MPFTRLSAERHGPPDSVAASARRVASVSASAPPALTRSATWRVVGRGPAEIEEKRRCFHGDGWRFSSYVRQSTTAPAAGVTPGTVSSSRADRRASGRTGSAAPTRSAPKPQASPTSNGIVAGPKPSRVRFDTNRDTRDERPDASSRSTGSCGRPRRDVVDRARHPALHQRGVRADDVAHVGDVALRIEVADPITGSTRTALDERNLPRDARRHERRRLPRPGVIERAGHDDVEPVLHACPQAELLPGRACSARTGCRARCGESSSSGVRDGA